MSSNAQEELPFARRLAEACALAGLLTAAYMGAGQSRPPTTEPLVHFVDGMIPFVPETVWFYLPGYWACFLLTVWAIRDARRFRAGMVGLATLTALAVPFFLEWTIAGPRPAAPTDPSWSAAAVRWLYATDPNVNTFPSLHVANSTFCAAITTAANRRVGLVVWLLAALVAVSVLTLKQHWAVDVPAGWALASIGVAAWRAQLAAPQLLQALPVRGARDRREDRPA